MNHRREDLARQALLAREDCRLGLTALAKDLAVFASDIADMEQAVDQLEAKRAETRQRLADQLAADGASAGAGEDSGFVHGTDRRIDHIARMEQRTAFAADDSVPCHGHAAVDREIETMRRGKVVEAELAALRAETAERRPRKTRSRSKAA